MRLAWLVLFIHSLGLWSLRAATLAEALNEPRALWTTSGSLPWYVQSTNTQDGLGIQAGAINRGQTSVVEALVTNASKVAFWAQTYGGGGGADYLRCFVGSGEAMVMSGYSGWRYVILDVNGVQNVRWVYSKDSNLPTGAGSAWLDDVMFLYPDSPPRIRFQPRSQTNAVGSTLDFGVTALGGGTLSYQWRFNGTNVAGATNISFVKENVQWRDAGLYSAVVSNPFGSVTSAVALLTLTPSLADAVDNTNLVFLTTEGGPWLTTSNISHYGGDSAVGHVSGGGTAMEAMINGPGTLSYWWKFQRTGSASLQFWLNIESRAIVTQSTDWQQVTVAIPAGRHSVRWRYYNFGAEQLNDGAWVDEVRFMPPPFAWFRSSNAIVLQFDLGPQQTCYIQSSSTLAPPLWTNAAVISPDSSTRTIRFTNEIDSSIPAVFFRTVIP